MCDFSMITWFDFRSLCDNGVISKSVPFHFGWCVLPYYPWGKKFLNCVWVRLLPMGPKDHIQKRSYLMRSPCCHRAKRLHIRVDNIMPIVNGWIPWPVYVVVWYICDKLPYVRFYGFGIILLVLTDYGM